MSSYECKKVSGRFPDVDPFPDRFFDVLQFLLDHGADTNVQDNDFSTPLHLASFCRCSKGVQLLLKHGANPNVQSKNGQTPLHVAL